MKLRNLKQEGKDPPAWKLVVSRPFPGVAGVQGTTQSLRRFDRGRRSFLRHGSLQETGVLSLVWDVETSTEGSARRRAQPSFPAFLQDGSAVVLKGGADQEPLGTTPSVQCKHFFFLSPSAYLCGKLSVFTIDNLFRLPLRCSMLTLKELNLNCGGRRGAFRNLSP